MSEFEAIFFLLLWRKTFSPNCSKSILIWSLLSICLGIIIVSKLLSFFFNFKWTKPHIISSLSWVLEAHQVFFEFADVSVNVTSANNDTKVGSRGVLLKSVWSASSTGSGIVRVYLIHQPTNFNATTREAFGGFNDVSIDIPVSITD